MIKVDERVFGDKRYLALVARVGDAAAALGALVLAWRAAGRHWGKRAKLVPVHEWENLPHSVDIASVGLAEVRETGVYLKGAQDLFARGKKVVPIERSAGVAVWEAYSHAYRRRYNTDPVRNATVNGQIANLVKRLGTEAPDVAAYYVGHSDAFYVRTGHAVGTLLRDAEKLRTEWATGRRTSMRAAREEERQQSNADVVREAFKDVAQ